jgi:hypothetical protein
MGRARGALTEYERFEKKMKNLEANVPYVYFTGETIGFTRMFRPDVDRMAKFVRACHDLGYAQMFQRRNRDEPGQFDYIIVLHEKLGMRVDGNGRFQEAERVSGY